MGVTTPKKIYLKTLVKVYFLAKIHRMENLNVFEVFIFVKLS